METRNTKFEEDRSWKKYALKQGYLINFQRGLLKAPKMQYYVLTSHGLISFNGKPDCDTKPLCFLPYERLSSIRLHHIELNSCRVNCMQLTSKTSSNSVLGFNSKEERDDWMMIMMKAFSEALFTTRVFKKSSTEDDEATAADVGTKLPAQRTISTSSFGQSLRRKRRKGDKGSVRRSKSYDALALRDVTNTNCDFSSRGSLAFQATAETVELSRKRKSEPNIKPSFPAARTIDNKDNQLSTSCSFEHRDSLTVQKELNRKHEVKQKSNMFSKFLSKLDHPVKHVH